MDEQRLLDGIETGVRATDPAFAAHVSPPPIPQFDRSPLNGTVPKGKDHYVISLQLPNGLTNGHTTLLKEFRVDKLRGHL